MGACGVRDQFITVHLYENGGLSQPERLRVRANEIKKFFTKSGKLFCYRSKILYTLSGVKVRSFGSIRDCTAFVLVPSHETFISCDYKGAFAKLPMREKAQMIKIKKKESQTIPSSCKKTTTQTKGARNEDGDCTSVISHIEPCPCPPPKKPSVTLSSKTTCEPSIKSPQCSEPKKQSILIQPSDEMNRRRGTMSKTASFHQDFDSDNRCDEECSRSSAEPKKCVKLKGICKESGCPTYDEKQAESSNSKKRGFRAGFWSKCCPGYVKEPKCRPSLETEDSRPVTRICLSGMSLKTTQTSPEDFRRAKKCLKAAVQLEKRRNAMYRNGKKNPNDLPSYKNDEPNCQTVLKAQHSYQQKRRMMEAKITQQLEKQVKKNDSCCGIKDPE